MFYWEQQAVVAPKLEAALATFDWPLIQTLLLRPPIGFAYFAPLQWLCFQNFADQSERIDKGLMAYDIAIRRGLDRVEDVLANYQPTARRKWTCFCGHQPVEV